jgi:hypothetical protein
MRRGRRESLGRDFGFVFEDSFERRGKKPWWGNNVGSSLAFEEEGKPEW